MKQLGLLLLTWTLLSCSSMQKSAKVELSDYQEITLKNGLKVLLMKDTSLPYVTFAVLLRSGSAADPEKMAGLSSMTASLLKRGTSKRSATQIAESLDQIGADFSASVSKDYSMISASGLSFHQNKILEDFSEILTEPSFPSSEINRVRSLKITSLKQTVDNPDSFVSSILDSYLYGSHPYGAHSQGTITDIKKIKKKHIIRHYVSTYRPNNSQLAVVGNFSDDIVQRLNVAFSGWKPRKVDSINVPSFPKIEVGQMELINRSDLKQTQIRFGHEGIKRTNPDYLAVRVANSILGGGGFTSRLMNEVRKKRGLTYHISSYFDSRVSQGPFVVTTFTRHDKVQETIAETFRVLKSFRKNGVTAEEVESAKALLKGQFPRAIETPESLAENLLILRFYGISDSYLTDYLSNISKISEEDVNRVIKKYIHPDRMKVLVYSSKSKVMGQLKSFGDVKVKNYQDFL